jgi:thiamine biosynthesis lipoprotein
MPHAGWVDFRFDGIGTSWEISTPAALSPGLRSSVLAEVERYDSTWSRFRADSLVTRMSVAPGQYELPPEATGPGRTLPAALHAQRRIHDSPHR